MIRLSYIALGLTLLAACSATSTGPAPTPANDASTSDVTDDAAPADAPPVDAPAVDVPPADVSTSFTMTPYLSATPERTFDMADMVLVAGRDYRAVIETDVTGGGRMVLDLYEDQTPVTVNSFVFLALHHYFDGLAFHRVIEGFVAQGGDPNTLGTNRSTWGTGGPGYMFDTETDPSLTFNGAGVLGMARSTALDSNGSQFFITLAATTSLNGHYTVFGRVVEGADVLARIARSEGPMMAMPPTTPTRMTRVSIEERAR